MNIVNGRLRDLARQAAGGLLNYTEEGEFRLSETEALEFARLIVQECKDTLLFHGYDEAVPGIEWMATNRFGVRCPRCPK